MSKYVLLVIINLPLLAIGIVSAIAGYKTSRISKQKCITEVLFWLFVGTALIFTEPLYNLLIRSSLTDSPPMSLFDIALLTLVVFCILLIVKINEKVSVLNQKLARIHERLAIIKTD